MPRPTHRLVHFWAALLPLISCGCGSLWTGVNGRSLCAEPDVPLPTITFATLDHTRETIRLSSHEQGEGKGDRKEGDDGKKNGDGGDKKNGDMKEQPKAKLNLTTAIQMCIANNFRMKSGAERVRQAEADLITASLIPNMTFYTDYQLIPLQTVNINNQLGPPQADVFMSVPIDWLMFGKRVANMQAASLGIDVSGADYKDLHRLQVARTVDSFYEILSAKEYLELAEENVRELEEVQKMTQALAANKKAGPLELDRIKLAVLEATLERHDRELALELARTRLRPLIGRTAADEDYELDGVMDVKAVVPPPTLQHALALADEHRADLISDRFDIARARAATEAERRKARPSVMLHPMWTYQNQEYINGFRNGSMIGFGLTTTLPITDRNQGNILRARAREQEMNETYRGDRADAFAEVEASVAEYSDAVEHISQFNSPATLKAAHDLHKNMEEAYRAGDRKLNEVLAAQRAYRDRLEHVIEFQSIYWRKLNKLNMVVGLANAYDHNTGATQPIVYPNGEKK